MNNLLFRVLWKRKSKWELVFASIGFLIGMFLFLFCLQVYLDMDYIFNSGLSREKQLDYLIISKKVELGTTTIIDPAFHEEEIKEIKSQSFVKDLGLVLPNAFEAQAVVDVFGRGFRTELFFEAVPDEFLDVIPENWEWEEGETRLPVMISRDFLLLYNFGFSQARGFPLVSEDLIKSVPITVEIRGRGAGQRFKAQVAGLSDRVASILVPYTFMKWANEKYGINKNLSPMRLIIAVKDRTDPEIVRFIESSNYETSKEKLRLSDAGFTIKIILGILGLIGIFLIILALVVFLTTFRLIILKNVFEIRLLLDLGYRSGDLVKTIVSVFAILLLIITIVDSVFLLLAVNFFHNFLTGNGIGIAQTFGFQLITTGLLIIAFVFFVNYLGLLRIVKKNYF